MVELSDALYQGPAKQNGAFIQENKKIHNKNQPTYQQKTTTKPTKQQQTINKKNPTQPQTALLLRDYITSTCAWKSCSWKPGKLHGNVKWKERRELPWLA